MEAIIIITTFTLLFMGMVFFRNVYLQKIRVARLSRASLMAYAMGGCLEGQDAATWAGPDLDPNANKTTPPATTAPPVGARPATTVPSQRTDKILKQVGEGSSGSPLNPIAELGLSMKVSVTTTDGRPLAERRGFRSTMGSTSFVTCGEEMKEGKFSDIIGYVIHRFNFSKAEQDPD